MASKHELRTNIRTQRRARGTAATAAQAPRIAEQLATLTQQFHAHTVACFASTPLEPPTGMFREWARNHGVQILLPRARNHTTLEWVPDHGELITHPTLRVPEPTGTAHPHGLATAELIIIPAAAVTETGIRLGWGGGFYDRALETLTPNQREHIYALIHDDEILDTIPHEPHDIPVAGFITPTRVHTIHATTR